MKYAKSFQTHHKDSWNSTTRKELMLVAKEIYDKHSVYIEANKDTAIVSKTLLPDAISKFINNKATQDDMARILKGVSDHNTRLTKANQRSIENSLNKGRGYGRDI